jgi:hydroxymethylglutaryl-CoA reductase (NADPH)
VGVHAQYANGLAALFLACGQDVACVAEAAMGVTRFEVTPEGDLYASVTLPNLVVGTVGGATGLPSQAACLELLGLAGSGHARAFAEVCAAVCLAGELSVTGALSAGEFARAHHTVARVRGAT